MINSLIKLASYLDESGLKKEADRVDSLIKLARGCEDGRFKDYDKSCVNCDELKVWMETTSLNISEQIRSTEPTRAAFPNTREGARRYNVAQSAYNKQVDAYNARHSGNMEIYNHQCSGHVDDPATTATSGSEQDCHELLREARRLKSISDRKCRAYNACLSENGGDETQCDQTEDCYNAIESANVAIDKFHKHEYSPGLRCPDHPDYLSPR